MLLSDSMASATKPYQDFSSPSRRARFRPHAGVTKRDFKSTSLTKNGTTHQTRNEAQALGLTIMVVIVTVP